VDQAVYRELIDPLLYKDEKNEIALTANPDWKKIIKTVKHRYATLDAEKMIHDAKLPYYYRTKNYQGFTRYVDSIIAENIPKADHPVWTSWHLNETAWAMFEVTNDKQILNAALKWIDLSISLNEAPAHSKSQVPNFQLYDTKANLLYKTGKVKEGIEWEEKALVTAVMAAKKAGSEKSYFAEEYKKIIDKMKNGDPTWSVTDSTDSKKK
jgi:hypothetical protein